MANPRPIKLEVQERPYRPKNAIKTGVDGFLAGTVAGLTVSAVQNSLARGKVGAWGIFTRTGSTIATFTAVGAVFGFSLDASANLREKDDFWNMSIASALAGATTGLRLGTMPRVVGCAAAFSAIMTTFEYTGGTLRGGSTEKTEDPTIDEYERKELMRMNRRRPIEETIADVGEGRGIKPPGYEERRRQRLKEKYGFEVNPVSATVQ
ncbi:hypothetical protein GGR56DRAFT_675565 [Xylariaceae sp. FL0804]|nr:hypothetical protein GGR56DRAFT_675565 [Xylariaceae sp. FL0804]